jgi:antitoxin HigA-1
VIAALTSGEYIPAVTYGTVQGITGGVFVDLYKVVRQGLLIGERNTLSELVNGKRGISPEMAVRISKVFGGTEEGWLVQQAQYDLAQVRRDRIKLKRLEFA